MQGKVHQKWMKPLQDDMVDSLLQGEPPKFLSPCSEGGMDQKLLASTILHMP